MRALVGLVVAVGFFATSSAGAGAAPKPRRHASATKREDTKTKQRSARLRALRERVEPRIDPRIRAHGQSVGLPWAGHLQHATALPPGDGYYIRRPARAFGTETTIELTLRAISETLDGYPDEHVLAIGDISAPSGGTITEHHSHQSGRDIDIGLFYMEKPEGYPASFIHADEDNLDCAATFKLLESFLATADDDGGVQMVFLDFDVQGILYHWALDQGISERRLDRIFQYPHGRGSSEGIVRHEPNHDNHMHVRFKCPSADTACH
jgi:murein endopeptidase